jgi:hypothetical protein
MHEKEKQAIIDAALEIKTASLIHMTGGHADIPPDEEAPAAVKIFKSYGQKSK